MLITGGRGVNLHCNPLKFLSTLCQAWKYYNRRSSEKQRPGLISSETTEFSFTGFLKFLDHGHWYFRKYRQVLLYFLLVSNVNDAIMLHYDFTEIIGSFIIRRFFLIFKFSWCFPNFWSRSY